MGKDKPVVAAAQTKKATAKPVKPKHFFVIRKRNSRTRVMRIKRDDGVIIILPARVLHAD